MWFPPALAWKCTIKRYDSYDIASTLYPETVHFHFQCMASGKHGWEGHIWDSSACTAHGFSCTAQTYAGIRLFGRGSWGLLHLPVWRNMQPPSYSYAYFCYSFPGLRPWWLQLFARRSFPSSYLFWDVMQEPKNYHYLWTLCIHRLQGYEFHPAIEMWWYGLDIIRDEIAQELPTPYLRRTKNTEVYHIIVIDIILEITYVMILQTGHGKR